jgi:hypothetical protein
MELANSLSMYSPKGKRCRFGRLDRKTLWKDVDKSLRRASKRDSEVEKFARVARQSPPACSRSYLKAVRHDQQGSSLNPIDPERALPNGCGSALTGLIFSPLLNAPAPKKVNGSLI